MERCRFDKVGGIYTSHEYQPTCLSSRCELDVATSLQIWLTIWQKGGITGEVIPGIKKIQNRNA